MLRKYIPYTIKSFAILVAVFFLLYLAAYVYVVANKKKIILEIKEQIADKLNGDVQIGNIDISVFSTFPQISALIEKISIYDTLYSRHHHPFFQAERIYASVSLLKLMHRENPLNGIRIQNAQVYLFTDTTGYTNKYLFSPKVNSKQPDKAPETKTQIDKIDLRAVRFILDDRQKNKLYDFELKRFTCDITTTDSLVSFNTGDNILIHSLAFNKKLGSYVKEINLQGRFKLFFNKNEKNLYFDNIHLRLKDHPFTLSGKFNFSKSGEFLLKVATNDIDYEFAKSLLANKTSQALSVAKLEKPVDEASAEISGNLNGGDPLVNARWKCNNNNVESSYANFTDCSFTGSYNNELISGRGRTDENSRILFQHFTGNWNELPINSQNIFIDNLSFPTVTADVNTNFNLTQLNNLLASNTLDLHAGKGSFHLVYTGPLENNTKKNTLLNGKLTFSDGVVVYHPRNIQLKNVSGNILFKKTDVYVNDLRLNAEGNNIIMNGSGKNLLALLKTNPGKIFIDWSIFSPSLNLGSFTSLLRKRSSITNRNKHASKLGSNLDEIVNQANFNLDVKAGRLIYKTFVGNNVRASVGLINENWNLYNVSLQHAGGSMAINGSLIEKNARYYDASLNVNMQNVDVNKVMQAFNNFGQNGITSENLRGKLTSVVHAKMDINRDQQTPSNINGVVAFSLRNGALMHYEPLHKIQSIAFKKRNFDEIYFAELKDTFNIKNSDITINRMEIASTVLRLFVEGVYRLHGKSDLSIQVPLSNLKKRDEDYSPENKGADAKGGASVYIRGTTGDDGNMKFKLDLFKKFRRKDNRNVSDSVETKVPEKPSTSAFPKE